MEVKGEVRDVQATLVPDMQIIEKAPEKPLLLPTQKVSSNSLPAITNISSSKIGIPNCRNRSKQHECNQHYCKLRRKLTTLLFIS